MAHVFQERKVSALGQFPGIDWNIKDSGVLLVNGLTYKWNKRRSKWVEDVRAVKISSEAFLSFFNAEYGKTEKVTLLLNLGGLALAEIYKGKVVYRYGAPVTGFHLNMLHHTLTKDVIDIINDDGDAYNNKVKALL